MPAPSTMLPHQLLNDLEPLRRRLHEARNEVLPLVGSGLSNRQLPSWKQLLELLIDRAPTEHQAELREALEQQRYIELAGFLEREPTIGPGMIAQTISQLYCRRALRDIRRPEAYDLIAHLPVTHFATTNYDPWLKDAVTAKLGHAPRSYVPEDTDAFNDIAPGSDPLVLMLHGDVDRPASCVLSERSYRRLTYHAPYSQAMRALVAQRTFLFVGYSVSDPDLLSFLDEWAQIFSPDGGTLRHWFLGSELGALRRGRFLDRGIQPISYGSSHDLLPDVLRHLATPPGPPPAVGPSGPATPASAGAAPAGSGSTAGPTVAAPPRALRPRILVAGPWFGVPPLLRNKLAERWKEKAWLDIKQALESESRIAEAQIAAIVRHDLIIDASPWRAFSRWSSIGFRPIDDHDREQPGLAQADTLALFLADDAGELMSSAPLRRQLERALSLPPEVRPARDLRRALDGDGLSLAGFESPVIVDIASLLSAWNTDGLQLVLDGDKPTELPTTFRTHRRPEPIDRPLKGATLVDYLRALRVVAGQVRIAGQLAERPIEDVFVELEIGTSDARPETLAPPRDGQLEARALGRESPGKKHDSLREEERLRREEDQRESLPSEAPRWQATRLLEAGPRLYLEGTAGTGKTTLLKWHAANQASVAGAERTPIWVRLSRLHLDAAPARDVAKAAAESALLPSSPELVDELAKRVDDGRVTLLLDGLDEATEPTFNALPGWLSRLHPDARLLLSSRPSRLTVLPGLKNVRLWGLSGRGPELFIRRYFGEPAWTSDLLRGLRTLPDGRRWARTPVLLSLASSLYEGQKALPDAALDLYERLIRQLLALGCERLRLDPSCTEDALDELSLLLANALLPEREGTPRRQELERHELARLRFDRLSLASGLFSVDEQVRLAHLTLAEFLAGRGAWRRAQRQGKQAAEALLDCMHADDDTREALPIAVAFAGKPVIELLMKRAHDDMAAHRHLRLILRAIAYSGSEVQHVIVDHGQSIVDQVASRFDLMSGRFSRAEEAMCSDAARAFIAMRGRLPGEPWKPLEPFLHARGVLGDEACILAWTLGAPLFHRNPGQPENTKRLAWAWVVHGFEDAWLGQASPTADERVAAVQALAQEPTARPLLLERLRDEDSDVRAAAVEALAQEPAARPLLLERLKDEDEEVRAAAVRALAQEPTAQPLLVELLKDEDEEVRAAAVQALAQEPTARPLILELLKDEDEEVRAAAVQALTQEPTARPLILRCLKDENWRVRAGAVQALAREPTTRLVLLGRLKDKAGSVRATAVQALAQEPTARPLLLGRLKDEDWRVRAAAVQALAQEPTALPLILELLKDEDRDVRAAAVQALAQEPTARPLLLERLRDEDWRVRAAAVQALAQEPTARPLILERLGDDDNDVRASAVRALAQEPTARPLLLERLGDGDNDVRAAAATALAQEPTARQLLLERLKDENWRVRAAAVQALAQESTVGPQLVERLRDENEEVRAAAVRALAQEPTARSLLLERLRDEDRDVRAAAVQALAQEPTARPLLLERLGDDDNDVRAAAVRALAQEPTARPLILERLKDENWRVRAGAVQALAQEPTTRPLLLGRLKDKAGNVRAAAATALAQEPTARQLLLERLKDDHPFVRAAAMETLAQEPTARPLLLERLRDEDSDVRAAAVEALAQEPAARPLLLERLRDEDRFVRAAAVQALAQEPTARPQLLGRLNDEDEEVRAAAVQALAQEPTARPLLAERLKDDNNDVRAAAVRALAQEPTARPLLLELLKDKAGNVRAAAVRALALEPTARPLLLELLKDKAGSVRTAAVQALAQEPTARPLLLELLKDEDWRVRAAAVQALAQEPTARSLLLAQLEDESAHVRGTIQETLDGASSWGRTRPLFDPDGPALRGLQAARLLLGPLSTEAAMTPSGDVALRSAVEEVRTLVASPRRLREGRQPSVFGLLQTWLLLRLGCADGLGAMASSARYYGHVIEQERGSVLESVLHVRMGMDRLVGERSLYPHHNTIAAWEVARHLVAEKRRTFWLVCADVDFEELQLPSLGPGEVRFGRVYFGFSLHTPETAPRESRMPLALALLTGRDVGDAWQEASEKERAEAMQALMDVARSVELEPWAVVPLLAHSGGLLPEGLRGELKKKLPSSTASAAELLERAGGQVQAPQQSAGEGDGGGRAVAGAFDAAEAALRGPVDVEAVLGPLERAGGILAGLGGEDALRLIKVLNTLWDKERSEAVARRMKALIAPYTAHASVVVRSEAQTLGVIVQRYRSSLSAVDRAGLAGEGHGYHRPMALRNFSTEQMIALSKSFLDPAGGRPVLEGHKKACVFVEDLEEAHFGLLGLAPDVGVSEVDKRLAAISVEQSTFDETHDRKVRGTFVLLGALADLVDDEAAREQLLSLRDALTPAGLSTTTLGYLEEAGSAARVRSLLKGKPELRKRLKAVPLPEGKTLDDAVASWLSAAESLGKLEAEKAALLQRRDQQSQGASGAAVVEARNAWVQAVHALERALTIKKGAGPGAQIEELFLRPLREAEAKADRRASSTTRPATPAPAPAAPKAPAGG